jgi:hypothetical protein
MILRTLLLLAFAGTAVLAKEAKPNVLFIVIDDMNQVAHQDPKYRALGQARDFVLPCLLYLRRLQSVACCHAYRPAPQHEWRLPKRQ